MRWLTSLVLAIAISGSACAQDTPKTIEAIPELEVSKTEFTEVEIKQTQDFVEKIRQLDPALNGASNECVNAFLNNRAKQLRRAFGREEGAIDKRPIKDILASFPECNEKDTSLNHLQPQDVNLSCTGVAKQGGVVLCLTKPHAKVKVARSEKDFYFENADEHGLIIIGFDRDEKNNFIEVEGDRVSFDLKPREYDTSRIDGLPPSQVSTFTDAQLKRIRSSSARKKVGFSSRSKEMGFRDGFTSPIKEYRKTTNFGAQRILNGEAKKPHYGVDMAAPVGTPIYAPADGIVSLADDDLYFEGAMVLLDHGQGLISMYLHADEILVEPGQRVKRGEQIATVGSKGRSTGPHLCWRLKWRNRNLDPELLTQWPQDEREH